jgi:hypothetical protein
MSFYLVSLPEEFHFLPGLVWRWGRCEDCADLHPCVCLAWLCLEAGVIWK